MSEFQKNKWKYSTIGLLAILAVGFSFPQAFAHVTSSISHNVGHIMDALTALQSDVTDIKAKTDTLPSNPASNIVRVTATIDDGADNLYDGVITFHRSTGTGAYQIEQLFLCDFEIGDDGADSALVRFSVDGQRIIEGTGASYEVALGTNPGFPLCVDLLFDNSLGSDFHGRIGLAGDGSHDIGLGMTEGDTDGDDDSDGAELVAYITGLNSASDMSIDSTTDDS